MRTDEMERRTDGRTDGRTRKLESFRVCSCTRLAGCLRDVSEMLPLLESTVYSFVGDVTSAAVVGIQSKRSSRTA